MTRADWIFGGCTFVIGYCLRPVAAWCARLATHIAVGQYREGEAGCAHCGHVEAHTGPAGDDAHACTYPGCHCGSDSRGDLFGWRAQ